jgi:CRP-like cAMP-binding protein
MAARSPFDLFQWLPDEARVDFCDAARTWFLRQGEVVYIEGEEGRQMFRLMSGSVRLSAARSDGRELLYLLFDPGACFGVSSCIDGERRPQTAVAAEDAQLQVIDQPAFDRLRRRHREFDDALMRLLARHMRLLSGLLADAHLSDLTARVASRIHATAQGFGVINADGTELSIRLPQSELALMVGAARQSVNKILQQLQKDGVISTGQGVITILSVDRLRAKYSAL